MSSRPKFASSKNKNHKFLGQADAKGRLSLGTAFAGALLLGEVSSDGTIIVLKRAEIIPAEEAWLFKNSQASSLVKEGLADVRAGRVTQGPDLNKDEEFIAKIAD